jgi:hypothetical protein
VQEKFNIAHLIGAVGVECILNYFKGTAAQIFGALLAYLDRCPGKYLGLHFSRNFFDTVITIFGR